MNNKVKKEKKLNYEISLKWVLLFWAIPICAAFYFGGKDGAGVVGTFVVLTLIIQMGNKSSSWKCEVVNVHTKKERYISNYDTGKIPGNQSVNIVKTKMQNGIHNEVVYNSSHHDIEIGDNFIKKVD